ncbi:hypothetical protein GCM10020220_032530 [Nonomuraea rubra]
MLITLILLGLVALIAWRLRKTARKNALAPGALFGARALTAAEHRQAAERLAQEGRWTQAIQERLRAIARDLEERALVDGMTGPDGRRAGRRGGGVAARVRAGTRGGRPLVRRRDVRRVVMGTREAYEDDDRPRRAPAAGAPGAARGLGR